MKLVAPLRGWAAPLDEVPDAVFAGRMLGDGVAIDPTEGRLHAPCDAEVVSVARTRHAVTLRTAEGAEILIHIGIETVALNGEGFTPRVAAGDRVRAGDTLIEFDLDLLARRAKSLLTPILVTNPDAFSVGWRIADREIAVGELLLEIVPVWSAGPADPGGDESEHRLGVVLGLPHGLHARPAGRLAALAKPFVAKVVVTARGRTADARSPVALMTLGATAGDELILVGRGADAPHALAALAAFLGSDGGETAAPKPVAAALVVTAAASNDGLIRGVSAAPGLAVGPAVFLKPAEVVIERDGRGPSAERAALATALAEVRAALSAGAAGTAGEIMAAHLALLDDPALTGAAEAGIAAGRSAGFGWGAALDAQAQRLEALDDERLRERAHDLIDLKRQVQRRLGGAAEAAIHVPAGAVLIADDLLPSELMAVSDRIAGLCTARGGPTSHVAIIAAAQGLPALVAADPRVLAVPDGAEVILDAGAGWLDPAPSPGALAAARAETAVRAERRAAALATAVEACRLADGTRIEVFANLERVEGAGPAVAAGAEGCGLLRTEFLFMERVSPPDEAEQALAYQAIADALGGRPLIVRTLDIGGDKPVAYLPAPAEDNPVLGLRGIRLSLARPELLDTQLRAILRVRPIGACRIMAPMIASLEELRAVRRALDQARADLGVTEPVELGVMVETPAAALIAAELAAEADFLSIGTNDLTQYALAMDRTNPAVAAGVDALHPAVLRLIALTCDGAAEAGKWVGVCGGLASEVLAAPLLIGLGVTELSAAPAAIPALKAALRPLTLEGCRALARAALAEPTAAAVRKCLAEAAR